MWNIFSLAFKCASVTKIYVLAFNIRHAYFILIIQNIYTYSTSINIIYIILYYFHTCIYYPHTYMYFFICKVVFYYWFIQCDCIFHTKAYQKVHKEFCPFYFMIFLKKLLINAWFFKDIYTRLLMHLQSKLSI